MRKIEKWMLVATLIVFSASVCTACTSVEDNPGAKEYDHAKKALLIIQDWQVRLDCSEFRQRRHGRSYRCLYRHRIRRKGD